MEKRVRGGWFFIVLDSIAGAVVSKPSVAVTLQVHFSPVDVYSFDSK
jgi:acyl-coenzyme A thioesterase PaaI-like protein